jgi:hypothetical protein
VVGHEFEEAIITLDKTEKLIGIPKKNEPT